MQRLIYPAVVSVQPFKLTFIKETDVNQFRVNVAECHRLEPEEAAIFSLLFFTAYQQVLCPEAIQPGPVECRFIGGNHSWLNAGFHITCGSGPDCLRPLMNIQKTADTMAGSVSVIHIIVPQRLTGKYIKLVSLCSPGETGHSEADGPLECQGKIASHACVSLSQGHCTGGISGSAKILSS